MRCPPLLIDAGTRIPGLRKIVEDIVKKPISLIIRQGHGDHIGAMNEWEEVWINAADEAIRKNFSPIECELLLF